MAFEEQYRRAGGVPAEGDKAGKPPVWRDNLDENGAAIRMRAGSRDDMMIALSLGLCKAAFYGAALQLPCVIATGRGKQPVQPCPHCPESDGWPSKWRPSRRARSRHVRTTHLNPTSECRSGRSHLTSSAALGSSRPAATRRKMVARLRSSDRPNAHIPSNLLLKSSGDATFRNVSNMAFALPISPRPTKSSTMLMCD